MQSSEAGIWAGDEAAAADRRERDDLLAELGECDMPGCGGSKLVVGELSPGCRLCAEGSWSCLFVSGRCNARCFFCPAPQEHEAEPETAGLRFATAGDYVDYLETLGFRGASLSGGEPLLDMQRTLGFAREIKARLGDRVYLWLYTNGIAVTPDKLAQLRDTGLDEIRFNLAATGYNLDRLRYATGVIPKVTVEVPAIPEDLERLCALLAPLGDLGVRHLNLHELRLTDHNLPQLRSRGYRFLASPEATVLASETTALHVLVHARRHAVPVGVHYCSFAYRDRYQTAAARRRAASLFVADYEEVTATGHIRRLSRVAPREQLEDLVRALTEAGHPTRLWQLESRGDALHLHPSLWEAAGGAGVGWAVRYDRAFLLPSVSYRNRFRKVLISDRRSLVVERQACLTERTLSPAESSALAGLSSRQGGPPVALPADLAAMECIPQGLHDR